MWCRGEYRSKWAGDWRLLNYPDNWRRLGPIYINYSDIGGRKRCKFSLSSDWRVVFDGSPLCYLKVCLRHTHTHTKREGEVESCDLFPDRCSCRSCLLPFFYECFFLFRNHRARKRKTAVAAYLLYGAKWSWKPRSIAEEEPYDITYLFSRIFDSSLAASTDFRLWKQEQIAIVSLSQFVYWTEGEGSPASEFRKNFVHFGEEKFVIVSSVWIY